MKLRFIKDWGHYHIGDLLENPSAATVKALVHTYKVAEVEKEKEVELIEEEISKEENEIVKEEETTEIVGIIEAEEGEKDRKMTEEELEEEAEIDKKAEEEIKESYTPPKKKKAPKRVSSKSKK